MKPSAIVVMGASGSGKSTVGRALAKTLDWTFHDADSFHSPENVARMSRGEALSDEDRLPWLRTLRRLLEDGLAAGDRIVLACSALRRGYRELLLPEGAGRQRVRFVYLEVAPEVLAMRLVQRKGHFMTASLLESQLATLEKPRADEALWLDGDEHPLVIVQCVREAFGL